MNKLEILKMSFSNLWRRKARSILAIIGVFIGTTAVIIMFSIGLGLTKTAMDEMKKDENIHTIEIYGVSNRNPGASPSSARKMDESSVKYIRQIPGVTAACGLIDDNINIVLNNTYAGNINIRAIDASQMEKMNFNISKGRALLPSDRNAIVLGRETPMNLVNIKTKRYIDYSPTGDYKINLLSNKVELTADQSYKLPKEFQYSHGPAGENEKNVKYNVYKFKSVGVAGTANRGYASYMDIKEYKKIQKEADLARKQAGASEGQFSRNLNEYSTIQVYIEDINQIEGIIKTLKDDGFSFYSIMEEINRQKKSFAILQAALGGIGAISLFVAAIGIANTMIMSIYERTREIGVLKVIGARLKDIRDLFLFESALIGAIGGLLGLLFSLAISFGINYFLGHYLSNFMGMGNAGPDAEQIKLYISYIPVWLMIVAMTFSTFIGVLSGWFPSRRAMKMSALESLRNE